MMRVAVATERCCASGNCVRVAPDVFDQHDEDGTVILLDAHPPPPLHDAIRQAAQCCPVGAISLTTDTSSKPGEPH